MQQFSLTNQRTYLKWREAKLQIYPQQIDQLMVNIANPLTLTPAERQSLLGICQRCNLVLYKFPEITEIQQSENIKPLLTKFAQQLGLEHMDANLCADEDRISSIRVMQEGKNSGYIPYTDKALNWHTDGYYNEDAQRIRAFLMHCIQPAESGGVNSFLDPEMMYILLRDENEENIRALMHPHAMTIPANESDHTQIRAAKSGPVFLLDDMSQTLYMRYSARMRNIIWNQDRATQHAREVLTDILHSGEYQFNYSLKEGEGVICNNVLHNRTKFEDNSITPRLLYRARFYSRVKNIDEGTLQCFG